MESSLEFLPLSKTVSQGGVTRKGVVVVVKHRLLAPTSEFRITRSGVGHISQVPGVADANGCGTTL